MEDRVVDTARVTSPRTGFAFLDARCDDPPGVLAFAHRGGAGHPELHGLENTVAAFTHAVDLGYRYLETDVHLTRDGVLLALHDEVLDRVAAYSGSVADLRHEELAGVRIGGREPIPTLAELFERFPDACFNIDLKAERAAVPLADLIARHDAFDRVCVAAFREHRVEAFRRAVRRPVATAVGPAGVVATRLPQSPLLTARVGRSPGVVLQVPHRRRGVRVVTDDFLARAHASGRHVHVWTVDEPEEMHELIDRGVDGLMTDRTDVLRAVLIERGQWRGPT